MNVKLFYIPHHSVGPFELGKPISIYLSIYPYLFREREDKDGWDEYSFFDEAIDVYVDEDSLITAISCRRNIYYNEMNLIGMDLTDGLKVLCISDVPLESEKLWVSNDKQQTVFEIEQFEMQLWVNDENKIVTVFIG